MSSFKLAVLGNPVAHSRSPDIHRRFGEMTGVDLGYEKLQVPDGEFDRVASQFLMEGTGFNITVPCKGDAYRFADLVSDGARIAEAVNTISRSADGKLRGDNTDGPGIVRDIRDNLGWRIRDQRILVLGAGGAVRGVMSDVLAEMPQLVHLYNRTHEKAVELAERLDSDRLVAVSQSQLEGEYDLIISGTSAGLSGENTALPEKVVGAQSRCYDMIYGAGRTPFCEWCVKANPTCAISDGLGMLVEQAAIAFEIWFDRGVETRPVIDEIRSSLETT